MTSTGERALAEAMRVFAAWQSEEEPVPAADLLARHPDLAHLLVPLLETTDGGRPAQIGPYRLIEVIGEGGMGTVWLADQQEPVRRRVALKLLRAGLGPTSTSRFEAERQVLALMNHPTIARIFDAGVLPDGRPYFAMELVEGTRLDEFCNQERLTLRERLRLLAAVCRGVQHAHQKGIIHRDLKPSNILVRRVDGDPVPKIIDFGVAKAIDQSLTEQTQQTIEGHIVGTPVYMSPEQASPTASGIDTRSDVYSLGVVLYELLAGEPPFDRDLLAHGYAELRRQICEVDPPRPSTRITRGGTDSTTIGDQRRLDPRRLSRALRGELDWITLRALEKDPSRRYQSASELAADIERYLRDEPVLAGPPSAAYRLRKFVRRNRAVVTAAVLALLALVTGAAVATWQSIEAGRAATSERALRVKAEGHRLSAEALVALADDPTLSMLLAIEGAKRAPGLKADYALQRALAQQTEITKLRGHDDVVTCLEVARQAPVAVSADDSLLMIAWDLERRCELWRTDEHDGEIHDLAFSADGALVASACGDGFVRVFRAADGECVARLSHGTAVRTLTFTDRELVTGADDGQVRAFDFTTWSESRRLPGHDGVVVEVESRGGLIASIGKDQIVRVSRASGPLGTRSFGLPEGAAPFRDEQDKRHLVGEQVEVGGDGRFLVAVGTSCKILVHDLARDERLALALPAEDHVVEARLCPLGRRLYVHTMRASSSRELIFDLPDGKQSKTLDVRGAPRRSAGFSSDGRKLCLLGGRAGLVFDARFGTRLGLLVPSLFPLGECRFLADGERVVTAGADRTVGLWRANPHDEADAVAFARGGEAMVCHHANLSARFVTTFEPPQSGQPAGGETRLRDRATGQVVAELLDARTAEPVVWFSPGGRWLAVNDRERRQATLWDLASMQVVRRFDRAWTHFSFSPDDRHVIVSNYDDGAGPWSFELQEAGDGTPLLAVQSSEHRFMTGTFDPGRGLVAVAVPPAGAVGIWDLASRKNIHWLRGHRAWITGVAWCPAQGEVLTVAADTTARAWEIGTWRPLRSYTGLSTGVGWIHVSPSGRWVAFSGADGVDVFERASARLSARWRLSTEDRLMSMRLLDDRILFGLDRGPLRTVRLDPLPAAIERQPRQLTSAELERYGLGDHAQLEQRALEDLQGERASDKVALLAQRALDDGQLARAKDLLADLESMRREERRPAGYWGVLACVLCRGGDTSGATTALRRAVALGWRDWETVERSPHLAAMRASKGFDRLLARLKAGQ